ncbi:prolipoprotein diacylglyceryl transferase [Mycoplasma phocoenae]|uniref:Phosphatidylglycerol--prolipoprotein diacylglyceryl transferase n=1 Tax=Mycoplasma phocoenae TaxID=754517 RepID=A0A858U779_9MOLU|nr:prolipoprotein diacylglyceryl transferase [Mycoplasma phocoenae]
MPGDPNTAFALGPIRVYSLLIMLGMICAILTSLWFWKREKYSFELFATLVIITLPTAIIGARLFFIFEQLEVGNNEYLKANWYKVWHGGLSIQGGVIVTTIVDTIFLWFHRKTIDLRKAFSIVIPTILIGQAIGRWGNFANHELFGAAISADDASISFLPSFIIKQMYIQVDGVSSVRVPLFFYESVANLFGYIVLCWILNKYNWLKPGSTGAMYWIFYGITRVSMENLRYEHYKFYVVLSIIYIVLGTLALLYFELSPNKRYTLYKVLPSKKPWVNKINYFYVWEDSEQYILRKAKEAQRKALLERSR